MSMSADLRDLLKAAGVANARVYRDEIPTSVTGGRVRLQVITETRDPLMKADNALNGDTVQVDCFGPDRATADDVAAQVLAARPVRAVHGSTDFRRITLDGSRQSSERSQAGEVTYRTSLDLLVWWRPASQGE